MRRLIVFITIVLVACSEKIIEAPDNLISESQMASILYDIAIINAVQGNSPELIKKNNIKLMPIIYEKYKIDSLQFVQSDVYYASIPVKYQEIYEVVEEKLAAKIDVLDKKEERRLDSVKKARELQKDSLELVKKTAKDSLLNK